LTHATEYYKVLFGHGEGNKVGLSDEIWEEEEKLSDQDNLFQNKK
jgi:hypothetical protein